MCVYQLNMDHVHKLRQMAALILLRGRRVNKRHLFHCNPYHPYLLPPSAVYPDTAQRAEKERESGGEGGGERECIENDREL